MLSSVGARITKATSVCELWQKESDTVLTMKKKKEMKQIESLRLI